MVTKHIAKRQLEPPKWWSAPPPEQAPPKLNKPDTKCYEDRSSGNSRLCSRCQEEMDEEQRQLEATQAKAADEKKDKAKRKLTLRERMRKKAKKS